MMPPDRAPAPVWPWYLVRQEFTKMSPDRQRHATVLAAVCLALSWLAGPADAGVRDLEQVVQAGELRHLGIRYANFVTGADSGLDVEVVRLFAEELGVRYVFVESDWSRIIPDLTGQDMVRDGGRAVAGEPVPVRGDIIVTGMTVLPWRADLVDFSAPMFPTQIWLIAPAGSDLVPIAPSGNVALDVRATRQRLRGVSVLTKPNTCLDPRLYHLEDDGAVVLPFHDSLRFMAPAVLTGKAEATILDVPDALVALRRYSGRIKVIGPISPPQEMAAAFAPPAVELRRRFDAFLARIRADGTYDALVRRYYPTVRHHYPAFFAREEVARP
jgi:ABC-type amino acid transport substrate-binding protein